MEQVLVRAYRKPAGIRSDGLKILANENRYSVPGFAACMPAGIEQATKKLPVFEPSAPSLRPTDRKAATAYPEFCIDDDQKENQTMLRISRTLTKLTKGAVLAAATVAAASAFLPGAVAPAEAKGLHGHHGHHHGHRYHIHRHRYVGFYGPGYVVAGYGYGGCGWLKARAIATGLPYWWNRYHACTGE